MSKSDAGCLGAASENSDEREPKIGRWWTICCHLDLEEIETEEDVADALYCREELAPIRVWDTKRQALEEMLGEAAPGSDEQDEIKAKLNELAP